MEIKEIIERARRYGEIQSISRKVYAPYKMEAAMSMVEYIGRAITPGFVIDDDNRWVYEQLVKWIHGDDTMMAQDPTTGASVPGRLCRGIYLAGNTGTGKSLALQLMSIYRRIDNVKIIIDGEVVNLNYKPIRVDSICDIYAQSGDITKFKRMPILCVQDLGAEPVETLYMGNRLNVMQQILETRGDRGDLVTLISSNFGLFDRSLLDRYGRRVVGRLTEMCNYLEMKGADRRAITLNNQK